MMEGAAQIINRRDLEFQLFEVNATEALLDRSRYADHSRETFLAAIDTAEQIAVEKYLPHYRLADEHEPVFVDGRVRMPSEVGEAVRAYCAAGLLAASHDFELGGMQLPAVVATACSSLFKSANIATASYPGLTLGNANVIASFGSAEQRAKYLPALLSGRCFGTMALTEPQAGSSLADICTTATPAADGSYRLTGNKIFISGGDHELTENIVHLVLARIAGAPAGVRGLSLFIVPKWHMNADGTRGERNDVALAGLIHKMGWRGTTSTMLSFGERGQCVGELIGEPNQGLACMFQMMNEARIGVGLGAAMLGYRGYLAALDYARERLQGRQPGAKDADIPPCRIIEHADVRRLLLAQKAYVEGAYGLCLYAARLVDDKKTAPDPTVREAAGLLLDLLTPVVKAWPAQWCLEANSLAIQVHGGYGYTREYPVEQFYRDNRLNPIHEGTNGVQALDLLGRKVFAGKGEALRLLGRDVAGTAAAARRHAVLAPHAAALEMAFAEIGATLAALGGELRADPVRGLVNASVFLDAFGHTVIAWQWLRQAAVAADALSTAGAAGSADFYRGKLQACIWFFRWELPKTAAWHTLLRSRDDTALEMAESWF